MANKTMPSLLAFLVILLTVASSRSLPKGEDNADKTKQAEWLIGHHQGTVLIPGAGRFMLPPLKGHSHGHSLKNYNPITGTYSPGGSGSGSPRGHVPGGDDTFVPNPGFEVPIPGTGSGSGSPVTGRP